MNEMTILLVEDEDAVRAIARRVLQRAGFEILEASTPDDALHIAEQHANVISLVVSDLVMPGMTGTELGVAVRRLRPDVPILYMSGYAREDVAESVGALSAASFVSKPFTPGSLIEAVRVALEA